MKRSASVFLGLGLMAAAVSSAAAEPGHVYAIDMRGGVSLFTFEIDNPADRFFITGGLGAANRPFGMDFDLDAEALYAVLPDPEPNVWGTVNLDTGFFEPIATISGDAAVESTIGGVAFAPDGTVYIASSTTLYTIDPDTAETTIVAPFSDGALIIDIAVDNDGNMWAHSISQNALFSVDPSTAEATLVGAHGFTTNFAQGIGMDRATNELYATLYVGGGEGYFVRWDTTDGSVEVLYETTPWNAEMTMAIRNPLGEVCIADWNGDGEVDVNDFFAYLSDFEAGDPRADLNNDGEIDINDFFIFLQEFEAGC